MRFKIEIKKNDQVRVLAGRDKGQTGRVLEVHPEKRRVIVENVNKIKKHVRPNPGKQIKGGIAERESPIPVSNVMIVCPGCHKAVRIAHHIDTVSGGKARRTRVCRKCGQTLDTK